MDRLEQAVELLDGPLDDPLMLAGNLRDLRRANALLGGVRLSREALDVLVGTDAGRSAEIELLDIGTGGADIPLALLTDWRRRGRKLTVTATDERPEVLAAARVATPGLERVEALRLEVADGRALPYDDRTFDVAHASLVLHHLDRADAVRLLAEMARVSRRGIVVNDLQRAPHAWLGAWLVSRLFTRNRYSRYDAPLSVRRAYTVVEMKALLAVAGLRPIATRRHFLRHRYAIAAVRA
ncbi:MAG TPA: methyltransferase domain-containing protein [Candidatus Limnocylindrales bacterium]|jgi:ubiquinone/menaquinone biosynthesis C-methylase UbiE|nr:methyltransferase domain-containing protein [Candidatus Limnocylindrales bacterium]